MKNWKKLKKELLKDGSIKKEYDKLIPKYQIISEIIELRKKKGVTQKELAELAGTKQTSIARIESGRANPTVNFLEKIATALSSKLVIKFE